MTFKTQAFALINALNVPVESASHLGSYLGGSESAVWTLPGSQLCVRCYNARRPNNNPVLVDNF